MMSTSRRLPVMIALPEKVCRAFPALFCCNDNSDGNQTDFASKVAMPMSGENLTRRFASREKPRMMALNIPPSISLYGYGYRNVYGLHECVNVNDPGIAFESSIAEQEPPTLLPPGDE